MSDDSEDKGAAPKKKKGKGKLFMLVGLGVVLVGGGVGGGLYATGMIGGHGGGAHGAEAESGYKLVPKSEQKRASAAGGEGEGHGGGGGGEAPPPGQGGDKYASNYYTMDKEFTSNLKESVHFVQVGLAVSTPYDDTVIDNLKTNEIAVRSAILMTLSDTDEDAAFTNEGKANLQKRLVASINGILKQKEGFGGISNVYFTSFVVQ